MNLDGKMDKEGYSRRRKSSRLARVCFYALVTIVVIVLLFPFYWMVATSFQRLDRTYMSPPEFLQLHPRPENYPEAFVDKPVLRWLWNTLVVSSATTIICILFSAFAAYSISRFPYRGRTLLSIVILSSQMFPGTLIVIPYYILMSRLKLLDSYEGLILTYISFTAPFCIWALKGFFDSIPRAIEEAAWIDGCSRFRSLFQIVLPLALPGMVATSLFAFLLSWHEFLFARTLLSSVSKWTIATGIASYVGEYYTTWPYVMAASTITSLPVVIIFILFQKHLVAGLTRGAVKE